MNLNHEQRNSYQIIKRIDYKMQIADIKEIEISFVTLANGWGNEYVEEFVMTPQVQRALNFAALSVVKKKFNGDTGVIPVRLVPCGGTDELDLLEARVKYEVFYSHSDGNWWAMSDKYWEVSEKSEMLELLVLSREYFADFPAPFGLVSMARAEKLIDIATAKSGHDGWLAEERIQIFKNFGGWRLGGSIDDHYAMVGMGDGCLAVEPRLWCFAPHFKQALDARGLEWDEKSGYICSKSEPAAA